ENVAADRAARHARADVAARPHAALDLDAIPSGDGKPRPHLAAAPRRLEGGDAELLRVDDNARVARHLGVSTQRLLVPFDANLVFTRLDGELHAPASRLV